MDIRYSFPNIYEKNLIKKISYNISSIFHSYELFQRIALKELCEYLTSGFVNSILQDMENTPLFEDYYKCLLYLAEAAKFNDVKNHLIKNEFFTNKAWDTHLGKFYQFSSSAA